MKRALSFYSQWKTDVTVILMYINQTNLMSSKILKKEKITYSFFRSKSFHYNLNNSIHLSTDNFI